MKKLVVTLALLLAACRTVQPSPPPPTPGPPDTNEPDCSSACARMESLGCEASAPTPSGASCESVCSNVMSSGTIVWDLRCRSMARTCDEVEACEIAAASAKW